ncbi:MAG: ABC transporter ATP-binding protein [Saprospiraceae bacterium]|nr:MAG: ABC transporter ATP-binding protein [Saprospiraceae bacterium]
MATGLSLILGILDGFGLTMFLPLLEMVSDPSNSNQESMGRLKFVADYIEAAGFSMNLTTVLMFLCIFFSLKGLTNFASKAYRVYVRLYFIRNLRLKMLQSLNEISYKKFIFSDIGRIQNTMTGEVERVGAAYRAYFWTVEQSILVAVYMGFAFVVDVQFALLVSIGGFLTNLIYKQIYKKTKGASRILTKDSHNFQSLVIQHVANFKYLKATGLLNKYSSKLRNSIFDLENSKRKLGIHDATLSSAREPILIIVVAVVIMIQIEYLEASLGPILISLLFFYRALNALMAMQVSYNQFLAVSGSMENMISFQQNLEQNKEINGKTPFETLKKNIEIKNLNFNYGQEKILKDVNLIIHKNETVAFVGPSGSGKTTFLNILAGLIPVEEGLMLIDSKNSREIDMHSFQRRLGYITQEPVVFNDTIFNNVTFWAEPSQDNINKFSVATEKASIKDFIESLPAGYNTELGNNGINLSGGQKQRIAIARELYKGIDILFMDEATSALDSETEMVVQQNIDQLKGQYTILVVAHRLSTIRTVDKLVLMENGRIVKIGDYESLMQDAPKFRRMVELQEL